MALAHSSKELIHIPELFSQTWRAYYGRLGIFWGVMIVPSIALLFVPLIFLGFQLVSGQSSLASRGAFVLLILLSVFSILIQAWGQVALLYAVKDPSLGVRDAYQIGMRHILSYWWISIIVGLATLGAFFLVIIPGIVMAIWGSLALFVLVEEDVRGFSAIARARAYVRGQWWSVAVRLLLVALVSLALYLPLNLLIGYLAKIWLWFSWFGPILNTLFALVVSPFVVMYTLLLYRSVRARNRVPESKAGTKVAFGLSAVLALLLLPVFLFAVVLGSGPFAPRVRDAQREYDLAQIRLAIAEYHEKYQKYPVAIVDMIPEFFTDLPIDPLTQLPYSFEGTEVGDQYRLCISFERREPSCVESEQK